MPIADTLPVTLRLGPVHLTARDLDSSVAWYQRSLGLVAVSSDDGSVHLGDGVETLVVVHADPAAQPAAEQDSGLFHFCLLYSTRAELARAALRLQATSTPVTNFRDRGTHEAIYLPDPDGNNIELAWDRARELWPSDPYGHQPKELDREDLAATIAGESVTPTVGEGMSVGHVHLTIGDLDGAVEFYRDQLGFDLVYFVGWGTFFSVGGYHHQFAANVRRGTGLGPQAPHAIGLRHWTVELPTADDVAAARRRFEAAGHELAQIDGGFVVRDPWEIPLHVIS